MSEQEENIEVIKKGYDAFTTGDMETMMSLFDDNIEWVQPGDSAISGTYHGKAELGQGFKTAFQQVAAEELGIDPGRISVRHGDTESTAFGFGTFASRSMVMSGGAVARASRMLRDKLCRIGAHLLQCDIAEVRCADGVVAGPQGSVYDR